MSGNKALASFEDFEKLEIRVGTIISARVNEKARKPAYVLEVDFGSDIGTKSTSAQITEAHSLDSLLGMQVVAVMNFPPKKVADVKSEFLVLGAVQLNRPTVLLTPSLPVENGSLIL